ncbi:hypothetical protein BGZ58_010401 [Dissophora ornata]|nr:hypothetical protein BGZ58_010401 [Dissophora ornata]
MSQNIHPSFAPDSLQDTPPIEGPTGSQSRTLTQNTSRIVSTESENQSRLLSYSEFDFAGQGELQTEGILTLSQSFEGTEQSHQVYDIIGSSTGDFADEYHFPNDDSFFDASAVLEAELEYERLKVAGHLEDTFVGDVNHGNNETKVEGEELSEEDYLWCLGFNHNTPYFLDVLGGQTPEFQLLEPPSQESVDLFQGFVNASHGSVDFSQEFVDLPQEFFDLSQRSVSQPRESVDLSQRSVRQSQEPGNQSHGSIDQWQEGSQRQHPQENLTTDNEEDPRYERPLCMSDSQTVSLTCGKRNDDQEDNAAGHFNISH